MNEPTWFCLVSLLILAIIGASLREVDWSEEARRDREKQHKQNEVISRRKNDNSTR
jgi:uncharacterized protein YpmS